jgi:putative ribosome biogenesis GTPase RsgA
VGPRVVAAQVAGDRTGRVVSVQTGLVRVRVQRRILRATVGAELLAEIARDEAAGPRVGDRVRLLCWADGRTTVENVLERAAG